MLSMFHAGSFEMQRFFICVQNVISPRFISALNVIGRMINFLLGFLCVRAFASLGEQGTPGLPVN